ncbi:BspC domain-containing protein [Cupriavidus sp. OTU4054]|uniref:BspC domain-containing protein n=1 Tax=unclassified Cupriavidus TaxID=2640874 RepID=UPI00406CD695
MIRMFTHLLGTRLRMLTAAVAGAIVAAGCATTPSDQTDASATPAPSASAAPRPAAPAATPALPSAAAAGASGSAMAPPSNRPGSPPASGAKTPTKTVTLPDKGRVSLAEYRSQMREQLMKTDNAAPDVADCAAHASWVVPRSPTFDALKIPTGALAANAATVEAWNGRFSPGKQAVPVTSVVTFTASAHKRQGEAQWQPVKVRCGYSDGMMLAYELLDSNGDTISEPAAAPAVATGSSSRGKAKKGKATAKSSHGTSARSSTKSSATKSTSSSKTSTKSTAKKKP